MSRPSPLRKRQDYINFLKEIELNNIYLESFDASIGRNAFFEQKSKIAVTGRARYAKPVISGKQFSVRASVHIELKPEDGDKTIGKLRATYILEFTSRSKEVNARHARQFARTNMKVIAWPYFRELIQNTTSRFGIPPVLIPIQLVD